MGINLGAFIGSQLVPWFAHWFGWRWGFALPAVGMAIGIAQFRLTRGYLNVPACRRSGAAPGPRSRAARDRGRGGRRAVTGALTINPVALSNAATWAYASLGIGYFVYLIFFAGLPRSSASAPG